MNDQTIALLEKLAAKLGVAVEVIWTALLRQSVIEGYVALCLHALFILAAVVLLLRAAKGWDADKFEFTTTSAIACVVCGSCCLLIAVVMLSFFADNLSAVLNPEYHAFREVTQLLH